MNGFYIPGDTKLNFDDPDFVNVVNAVMYWAGNHNDHEESTRHFPVVGVSYGYLCMIQSQIMNDDYFQQLKDS